MEEKGATTKSKVIPKLARHATENNNVQAYLDFCETLQKQVDEQVKKIQNKGIDEKEEQTKNNISMFSDDILREYGLKPSSEKGKEQGD